MCDLFNYPIKNVNNSIFTNIDNYTYVIFLCRSTNNKKVNYDQIEKLSSYLRFKIVIKYNDVWNNKIVYLSNYNGFNNYTFTFFYGIAINSLLLLFNVRFNNLSYGISINDYNSLRKIDYFNCLTYKKSAVMRNYSMYIKNNFFMTKNKTNINFLFYNDFSFDDYYFFLCILFFPDFFFCYFRNYNSDFFLNEYKEYINYVKEILFKIKKRRKIDISNFTSFINQLL